MLAESDIALIDKSLLPPQLRALIQSIGLPDTIKLLEARGGTMMRFPISAVGSNLETIIGIQASKKLCVDFGNKVMELPKADKVLTQIRNHAISNARQELSASKVGLKFGLTRRHIINITSKDKETTPDLFADMDVGKGREQDAESFG